MTAKTRTAPPEEVDTQCPSCDEFGPHRVEKGHVAKRGGAVEGAFTCQACGHTHQGLVEVPVPVDIPLLVGDVEGHTEPLAVQVLEDEDVKVGDEFEVEESLVEVTAVELGDGRRVTVAPARDIQTLWGKDITQVRVPFAMNVGSATRSFEAPFGPEDTIGVGDTFDLDGTDVEVKQVVTEAGRRKHGRHSVREIRRVWLKRPGGPERDQRRGARGGGPTGGARGRGKAPSSGSRRRR